MTLETYKLNLTVNVLETSLPRAIHLLHGVVAMYNDLHENPSVEIVGEVLSYPEPKIHIFSTKEEADKKSMEYKPSSAQNNGGKTSYYNLPVPAESEVTRLIQDCFFETVCLGGAVNRVFSLFPSTLLDIMEAKNFKPWQHEVMKACYAIEDRKDKNGGSYLRELNKIIFYAERAKAMYERGNEVD